MPNLFRHLIRKVSDMQVCYMQNAHLVSVNILWDAETSSA
jgi:hypothetical protein